MKINYEDIITKANARKEALQDFSLRLAEADKYATQLIEALQYFNTLRDALKPIDDEGQRMIQPIARRVNNVGYTCSVALNTLTLPNSGNNSDEQTVVGLVRALK